jgi:predicted transcriptional regulator
MKQRSSYSIETLILSAVASGPETGLTRTKITQELVVKYARGCYYVNELVMRGLLVFNSATVRYQITPKGREYLRLSEELANYIQPIRKMIDKYEQFYPNAIAK